MDYDYIRKYKLEDVQLKSSRKYFIITSFIIGIVEIVLLIGFRTEPVQFWSVIAIGFMIISLQLYSEVWSIKTENESLNVKLGITQYTIPFRDFINIKLIKRRGKRRGNYDYSYYYDEILKEHDAEYNYNNNYRLILERELVNKLGFWNIQNKAELSTDIVEMFDWILSNNRIIEEFIEVGEISNSTKFLNIIQ